MKNTLRETITIHTFFADKSHTHNSILIIERERIYEMMMFFPLDIPLAFIATRCSNSGILQGDTYVHNEREWVLDSDYPRLSFFIVSMSIYITSSIYKEIIISECKKDCGGHIYSVPFGNTPKVEVLILSNRNHIGSDENFGEIYIDFSVYWFEFSFIERMAISKFCNLYKRIKQAICLSISLFTELHNCYESR